MLSVVFESFFGLEYQLDVDELADSTTIRLAGGPADARLVVSDGLFETPEGAWLTDASLPRRPLPVWDAAEGGLEIDLLSERLPILYGKPVAGGGYLSTSGQGAALGIDVFGSSFFMLTRYEELVGDKRDALGRFPAAASVAAREGFLHRPIVNEYAEVLWRCMKRLWPGLRRRGRAFRVLPSHDVDRPSAIAEGRTALFRRMAGDLILRRSLAAARDSWRWWTAIEAGRRPDPYDTFDWIMDQSESAGCRSAFYWMAGGRTRLDPAAYLEIPGMRDLADRIRRRGHEIGFHPSYAAAEDEDQWREELRELRRFLGAGDVAGGRQHCLRFVVPETWRLWHNNGLRYDSSLTFADQIGFRCGTCTEYPVFDLRRRERLALNERPPAFMECTLIDQRYMGLGVGEDAFAAIRALRQACRRYRGDWVFLWHNHRLVDPRERELYLEALRGS